VATLWLAGCAAAPPESAPAPAEVRAVVQEAQAQLAAGTPDPAVATLRSLVRVLPDDALARATLAQALLLRGDLEGALVQGKLAVGIDPSLAAASWNVACAHARLGDRDAAVAWLQRAVVVGGYSPLEVRDDPDLVSLLDDHRIAVFFATGVLSRAEEDALVVLDRSHARVGEPVTLSVALVQLNRDPLARSVARLDAGRDQGLPAFVIRARRETFTRGEAGGREYAQRTVHFELVPQVPGPHQLGPFRFEGADGVHWTTPTTLVVDGEPTGETPPGAQDFFALPSVADGALVEALGDAPLWDMTQAPPDTGGARVLRFRLPSLDAAFSPPPPPPGSRRSVLLRRSTEGLSWVIDTPP
jgi:hypothetical protein